MPECNVLEGVFAVFVQGLLFCLSLAVLVGKYCVDPAGRTPAQFALDSSKQIFGAGWTHIANLGCAILLENVTIDGDECAWYWAEIMVDTTLGVGVEYVLLIAACKVVASTCSNDLAIELTSGEYFDDFGQFRLCSYVKQLVFWLFIVSGMKFSMVCLLIAGAEQFQLASMTVLHPFFSNPNLKLLVVMILTPGIMNAVQFWLVDNIFVHAKRQDGEISNIVQCQNLRCTNYRKAMAPLYLPIHEEPKTPKTCCSCAVGDRPVNPELAFSGYYCEVCAARVDVSPGADVRSVMVSPPGPVNTAQLGQRLQ